VLRNCRSSYYSFKVALLLYEPPGLKFQNSASCLHSGFICFCMDMRTNRLNTTAAATTTLRTTTTNTNTTNSNTTTISVAATSNNIYYC
jgi:hypothetical protein